MAYMWGLVNTLQIIVLTVLFDLKTPLNVRSVLIKILKLCNFDLFQTEKLYELIFDFTETQPFNDIFEEAEYDSSNYIQLIGTLFILAIFYIIFVAIQAILRRSAKVRQLIESTWMR